MKRRKEVKEESIVASTQATNESTKKITELSQDPPTNLQPKHPETEVEGKDKTEQDNSPLHSISGTARQFLPPYQPMFPQPGGFNMIRRQFGGGMELLGDIVVMGMIGLPILGLLTVGSSSIANFFGLGSSSSSKSSSKRNRRSLKEKAVGAVEYAKTLWEVMEQLEKAFERYDLEQAECRLRAVCESHQKFQEWELGDKIFVTL
ncbi:uncharacterized protein CEXT_338071 [Caerostris extrusa]|uniref:Uncharacterized protein n=1 Tax=Caerostris extrusa TaxID=172846 RepID=A0AAV4Y9D1_CAEEX|nr:uncharacterized protein CEXT_338071 [Caerostris extrusa]